MLTEGYTNARVYGGGDAKKPNLRFRHMKNSVQNISFLDGHGEAWTNKGSTKDSSLNLYKGNYWLGLPYRDPQ